MAKEGKKPIGKIVLGIIVVLVIVGAVGSMGGNSTDSSASDSAKPAETTQQAEEQKEPQEPYTIADEAEDTSNQFTYKISGTLTNNTDKEKSYIQIEYVLYDADGNQVGTALANTNHLKAGGLWCLCILRCSISAVFVGDSHCSTAIAARNSRNSGSRHWVCCSYA